MEKGSVYGVDFDLFLLKALDGVTALERAYVPALQKLIDKYEADRFGEPLTTVRVRRGQSGAVATSRWNSSPSPPLEASRMIGRYEEDGEIGFGKVRGKIYELSLGDESGLYGIADTQFTVYDGQEFAIVHQITGDGHSEVLLNAKQIAKLFEIVDDRLSKHEKARGDLINSAAFDPDGEA